MIRATRSHVTMTRWRDASRADGNWQELVVEVESSVSRPRCPHCEFGCGSVHDTRWRKRRDLEVSGRHTTLVWYRRRLLCGNCGERFLEDCPAFEGRLTRRLARRLVADVKVMTVAAAASRHKLSWHVVRGARGHARADLSRSSGASACRRPAQGAVAGSDAGPHRA